MYVGSRRINILMSVEQKFARTFAAQTTTTKRKRTSRTKRKKDEPITNETADPSRSLYPFYLPKEQATLPGTPISIPHNRMEIDDVRYYKIQGVDETHTFPGVTHVLSATRPRSSVFAMKGWEKSMIKEHGVEGYEKMRELIRTQGHDFHKAVGDYLLNKEVSYSQLSFQNRLQIILRRLSRGLKGLRTSFIKTEEGKQVRLEQQAKQERQAIHKLYDRLPETEGFARSVEHVVNDISEVYAVESVVSHTNLGYVGTVDLVAKYRDEVCVIDWKTSHKPRPKLKDIHDYPLQTIAYAGAINDDKNYPFNVSKAVIVVVYISGEPADVHMFNEHQCIAYWREWLDRLDQFQKMFAYDLKEIPDE